MTREKVIDVTAKIIDIPFNAIRMAIDLIEVVPLLAVGVVIGTVEGIKDRVTSK